MLITPPEATTFVSIMSRKSPAASESLQAFAGLPIPGSGQNRHQASVRGLHVPCWAGRQLPEKGKGCWGRINAQKYKQNWKGSCLNLLKSFTTCSGKAENFYQIYVIGIFLQHFQLAFFTSPPSSKQCWTHSSFCPILFFPCFCFLPRLSILSLLWSMCTLHHHRFSVFLLSPLPSGGWWIDKCRQVFSW